MAELPEVRPEVRTGISSPQGQARLIEARPVEVRSPIKDRPGIWERCQLLYANDWFRRSVVGLVLATAAILQYYLVNLPVADLSQTTKFSPAKVMAADEVVSFTNPQTEPGHFSFSYEQPAESQAQRMLLSVRFDHATLTEETLAQFATLGIHAPPQADAILYATKAENKGNCSTAAHVDTAANRDSKLVTEFTQKETAASDRYRLLEFKSVGADTVVTLLSKGAFMADNSSPCQVDLSIGGWQQRTAGFLPIKIKVPAGSNFRFAWEAQDAKDSAWPKSGSPRPLICFGTAGRQSFTASEIRIASADNSGQSANSGLMARSASAQAPIKIEAFQIGTDLLQFQASGRARVWEDGRVITTANLIDTLNRYPLIAALFAAANLGLLNWAKKELASRKLSSALPFSADNKLANEQKPEIKQEEGQPPGGEHSVAS